MKPKYTDQHRGGRYRTSEESREPGYLARRMKAYARLERMKARQPETNVEQFPKRKVQR